MSLKAAAKFKQASGIGLLLQRFPLTPRIEYGAGSNPLPQERELWMAERGFHTSTRFM